MKSSYCRALFTSTVNSTLECLRLKKSAFQEIVQLYAEMLYCEKSSLNNILQHNHILSLFLQHMHEAVELKQQLQIEHEQALVALHTKQKEINQLQKVWPYG